jgi:hypothetical protein
MGESPDHIFRPCLTGMLAWGAVVVTVVGDALFKFDWLRGKEPRVTPVATSSFSLRPQPAISTGRIPIPLWPQPHHESASISSFKDRASAPETTLPFSP